MKMKIYISKKNLILILLLYSSKNNNFFDFFKGPNFSQQFTENIKNNAQEIAKDLGKKFTEIDILTTLKNATNQPIQNARIEFLKPFDQHPYIQTQASVKTGQISDEEKNFIEKRKNKIQQDLKSITGSDKLLNIGLCISGGGYRAMASSLGLLKGLQEKGILDCIQYISTLSGSTWGVGFLTSSGKSIDEFKKEIKDNIKNNPKTPNLHNINNINFDVQLPLPTQEQAQSITHNLVLKFLFDQPLSSIDIWGASTANNLIKTQKYRLSEQQNKTDLPMPIYTAVSSLSEWFEFNPYDVRNLSNNKYIPSWAFGRKFVKGQSETEETSDGKRFPPESPLSFLLGICTSAFSVSVQEVIRFMEKNDMNLGPIPKVVLDFLITKDKKVLEISGKKALSSETYDFSQDSDTTKLVTLADAGIDFGLPFPPLLQKERDIDLIIVFDTSENIKRAPSLRGAINYANNSNNTQIQNLPDVTDEQLNSIDKQPITILKKPGSPTIIYFPLLLDCKNTYCDTFNFGYTQEEFDEIFNTSKNVIVDNFNSLKDTIIEDQKNKQNAISRYALQATRDA
jgi:cytosolic phospholipase A2